MKKILTLILIAGMAVSVCGCKNEEKEEPEQADLPAVSAPEMVSAASSEPSEESHGIIPFSSDTPESSDNRELAAAVPETGEKLDSAWFDDAVFVGDSVTLKLSYYAENGNLGDATFLCAGSLGYENALMDLSDDGNVHPMLGGEKITVDDGVYESGKTNVFIMLGMNDIGIFGPDDTVPYMEELTRRILNQQPDAEIYIQSVTPMVKAKQGEKLNNKNVTAFNKNLKKVCDEKGFHYLHVAEAVADENGDLIPEYCSDGEDMGIHFTDEGCQKWIEYLKTHIK